MTSSPAAQTDADQLLRNVLALSVPLHPSIEAFDELQSSYELAGPPGIAMFQRDDGDTIAHASSSPTPDLVPPLVDLKRRHLDAVGVPRDGDNSHLLSLLLLCMCLADPETARRHGLHEFARKPAEIVALTDEEGRHDPELERNDVALRAWTPLFAHHAPDAGMHPAILELRFRMQRSYRYVPGWHSQG